MERWSRGCEQKMLKYLQNCRNFKELKSTHLQILVCGLQESSLLLAKLIDVCSAFKALHHAVLIFEHIQMPNVVVQNNMIKCFDQNSCRRQAFSTYNKMTIVGVRPNNFTFTFLLKSCESSGNLEEGKEVHCQIIKYGYGDNVFVQNTLLDFYSKCSKDLALARQVFDNMLQRDVVSWNSMINACMTRGDKEVALDMFESMPERNVVSWNSVITGLVKAGEMEMAGLVFDRMATRDTVSWNALITGYVTWGDMEAAQTIFDQMEEKSVVSWTAMVSGYAKIGNLERARKLFDKMPAKNVVSWNAMIAGYNQNSQFDRALRTFHSMLIDKKIMPDEVTLTTVVSTCAHLGALEHGNWIHSYIKKNKYELSNALGNALIDMFAKCGDVKSSESVFNQMTGRCVITWTTMIAGLAFNGQCREAFSLFEGMCREGLEPDDVVFIATLSACTHGGLVKEGRQTFERMVGEFGMKPRMEHYGCMVDLLGRAGKFEEAIQFIESMPQEPNAVIWATLLSSCKTCGNEELVELVSRKIANLEPLDSGYTVLISNSSASVGRWESVSSIREVMRQERIEKVPGCSSIQVGNEVCEFIVKDLRHKRRKEIYEALDGLTQVLRHVGYVPCSHQNSQLCEWNSTEARKTGASSSY